MGAAVIMTLMSMVDYFISARDVLVGPWSGSPALAATEARAENAAAEETDETTA